MHSSPVPPSARMAWLLGGVGLVTVDLPAAGAGHSGDSLAVDVELECVVVGGDGGGGSPIQTSKLVLVAPARVLAVRKVAGPLSLCSSVRCRPRSSDQARCNDTTSVMSSM